MIPRYDAPEISSVWDNNSKFQTYLKAEIAILKALEESGEYNIPKGTAEQFSKAKIKPERVDEIEREVKHDVIAFCTSITEQFSPELSKYFHFGVTSSDIIDTATTLQIKESLEKVTSQLESSVNALKDISIKHKDIICMGRSHGMFAEPMSFGVKFLGHYAEFNRRLKDYKQVLKEECTGQFSGAVGNYTILNPAVEKKAVESLGLKVEEVSTQVIPRDRIAKITQLGALLASAIERVAVEIRHLHHSDIAELHEGFAKGQKGSSTMPHKKNPISGENLSGLARVIKSHAQIALENNVLWHERDISHSSAERMFLPDHFGLLFYSLKRLTSTIENLVVHKGHIEAKVANNSTYLSSYYLHQLLIQTDKTREELYRIIQAASFENKTGSKEEMHQAIVKQLEIAKISGVKLETPTPEKIKEIFLGYADEIFVNV